MANIYSQTNSDGKLEKWPLRLIVSAGEQPLPKISDIGVASLKIHYCLWNEEEYNEKLSVPPVIDDIPSLQKNTIVFPSEGNFPWSIFSNDSVMWETQISQDEFENAYCLMIWADPIGSAAFFDGSQYWKGVLRIDDMSTLKDNKKDEGKNYVNHITEVNLKISQGVISYFIDLVEKYSSDSFNELKLIHDEIKKGNRNALGRLGVMGLSIGDNDTCYMSMAVDVYEAKNRNDTGRKEDLYDGNYYNEQRKVAFGPDGGCINNNPIYYDPDHTTPFSPYFAVKVKWGQSNISIYDFKSPIKQLYAEMIRIGNDGRIYSNEGFSNLNWGIIGKQLELTSKDMKGFAALDPRSNHDEHDDAATDMGYEIAGSATSDKNYPVKFDRRTLFFLTLKSLRENDLFTCLGAETYKAKQEALKTDQQTKR
ncbi:hypothetical protein MTR55_10820 [Escherichia coli]|nr:hypothetical protein [Escherichia coli]